MDAVAREKAVYLAKLAEQAERYDGMYRSRLAWSFDFDIGC
jgi:hypothetical protein